MKSPMFGHRHYECLAQLVKDNLGRHCEPEFALRLADKFSEDNPRFDRLRFLKAAGVAG